MTESAVEIRNVWKNYASHTAVRDFSLTIPAGTVYGLLGPNGAGKTTLIRMILNIIAPDSGSISIFGYPPHTPGLSDYLGYLPEERGLYRKMQVRRVLRFLAELKGVERAEADRRIDSWLERLGLRSSTQDWGDAKVFELSRGMQQKVQFISAMLHDPKLVILDEPFSGLDAVHALTLQEIVLDLRRQGKTVIFSTHIIANAESMCDAVCILANGEKLLDGSIPDVKTRYGGPPVERTVLIQPSLHDIFIQQVGAHNATPEANIYA
jgi:ABC-2 type transport system ATP-binding protein